MKKSFIRRAAICLLAASVTLFATAYFIPQNLFTDQVAGKLCKDVLPSAALAGAVFALAVLCGCGGIFAVRGRGMAKKLVWCLPCLGVALANFPYTALASGSAVIDRPDLIWLFVLKCLAIALGEEILFRGILLSLLFDYFKAAKRPLIVCVVASSAIFGLFHLFNLFEGAGIAPTLLQVGYTFLTGLMFACTAVHTGNIWCAAALHFVFDIGGLIVTDLGHGAFQDVTFWVLTAVAAAICAVHLILYAVRTTDSAYPAPAAQL